MLHAGLKKPAIDHNYVTIEKTGGAWVCSDPIDAFSLVSDDAPPSVHFGCERVSLAPMEKKWLRRGTVIDWGFTVTDADLGKVYADFLIDCPIMGCDSIAGGNQYLIPTEVENHANWVNVWGGGDSMSTLASAATSTTSSSWPSRNWVAMGDPLQREFEATLYGTLSGAPALSTVTLESGGIPVASFNVPPDPGNPPCGGLPVAVYADIVTPLDNAAEDGVTLTLPDGACGDVPEGTVVSLEAEVVSRAQAPCFAEVLQYGDSLFALNSLAVNLGPGFCGQPYWEAAGGLAQSIDGMTTIPTPEGACGFGPVAMMETFPAEVPCLYQPGDLLYNVDVTLANDTFPPAMTRPSDVFEIADQMRVEIEIADQVTDAMGAVLLYSINGAPEVAVEMLQVSDPADTAPFVAGYQADVSGVEPGDTVDYRFGLADEFGNETITLGSPTDSLDYAVLGGLWLLVVAWKRARA